MGIRVFKVRIAKSFTGHLYAEGESRALLNVLEHLRDACGRNTADVEDAIRILKNFDVFYDVMRRKFKDFIAPRKEESDLVRGRVTVDKIKLVKDGGVERAVIVFDKRVPMELLTDALDELGIEYDIVRS